MKSVELEAGHEIAVLDAEADEEELLVVELIVVLDAEAETEELLVTVETELELDVVVAVVWLEDTELLLEMAETVLEIAVEAMRRAPQMLGLDTAAPRLDLR